MVVAVEALVGVVLESESVEKMMRMMRKLSLLHCWNMESIPTMPGLTAVEQQMSIMVSEPLSHSQSLWVSPATRSDPIASDPFWDLDTPLPDHEQTAPWDRPTHYISHHSVGSPTSNRNSLLLPLSHQMVVNRFYDQTRIPRMYVIPLQHPSSHSNIRCKRNEIHH